MSVLRARPAPITLIAGCVTLVWLGYVLNAYWLGFEAAAQGGVPLFTDFTTTYAASMLLQTTSAEFLYDQASMVAAGHAAGREMYGTLTREQVSVIGFSPFMYPPTFMFFVQPLAKFPYFLALLLWLLLSLIPLLLFFRKRVVSQEDEPELGIAFLLAAPPVFFNVMYGQTGFLIAALLGWGAVLLRSRPVWAGVLIGLASVKPHLGMLIPVALMFGGYWRTFFSALLTLVLMITMSVIIFGAESWYAFIGTSLANLDEFKRGLYALPPMTTLFSQLALAKVELASAMRIQGAQAFVVAGGVAAVWWLSRKRDDLFWAKTSVMLLGCLHVAPMLFLYDLVIVLPAVWMLHAAASGRMRNWGKWLVVIFSLIGSLYLSISLAHRVPFQLGYWVVAALLVLSLVVWWEQFREPTRLSIGFATPKAATDRQQI